MGKKSIKDFILNIVASAVVTAGLQLISYPFLAQIYTSKQYGVILTVMGLCNMVSATFGNALNNARLIQHERYVSKEICGDFNFLLVIASLLATIAGVVISLFVTADILISILLGMVNFFSVNRLYFIVAFRLNLNYTKILKCNLILAAGYVIGGVFCSRLLPWPCVFLCGEVVGSIYVMVKSDLLKESLVRTPFLIETSKVFGYLILSTCIVNVVAYLDRLFLYPIMGSEAVSIYTVASILGKCAGIIMLPISGVLLSYYAQVGFSMDSKRFYHQCAIMCGLALIFIILLTPVSPIVTKLLYPTLYNSAKKYIFWANIAAIVGVLGNMLTPAIIKFAETYWQVVLAVSYAVVYLLLSWKLTSAYGLMGFCFAALFTNLGKCLMLILLGKRIDKNTRKNYEIENK